MFSYRAFSFFSFLFVFFSPTALAIVQNVTVDSSAEGVQYLPANAWTISSDSRAAGGSFARASAENATVRFDITIPSTAIFWHGFPPPTAARYSICIDCSGIDTLGSVVTIDSGTQADQPVILFASKPLANTSHSIVVRNLRNPIEGVVGEISLDGFSFATDVEVLPPSPASTPLTRSPNPSAGEIAGIVVGSVVAAGVLLALARCIAGRHRTARNNCATKRPKIWRKSILPCGSLWKRHRRTASSESSPIIEAVWKSKPLTAINELPIHNAQTQQRNVVDTNTRSIGNQPKSTVPVITITSPSTNSTTASLYSSTHQDVPAPSPFKLSIYETERGVRKSDPYASYAAAYAAFAGITNNDDDDHSQAAQRAKQSALRDSSLLPPTRIQDRGLQSSTSSGRTVPPHTASSSHNAPPPPPPSSFNGRGIREGQKGKRTLSDKIKRGTLPVPPQLEGGVVHLNVNVTVPSSGQTKTQGAGQDYVVEGDLKITPKSKRQSQAESHKPSMPPTLSDSSATPPKPTRTQTTPLTTEQRRRPSRDAIAPSQQSNDNNVAETAFWSGYGDFSILETPEYLEQVAESSSDGVESTLDGGHSDRAEARRQSFQPRSSPSPTIALHRPSKSEGGDSRNEKPRQQSRPLTSTLSMMTVDTSHTHTTRSSFSLTPSVSEFPMPPFKQASTTSNSASRSASTVGSDTNTSASAITDLVASTPSPSSGSGSATRGNVLKEKVPPSAFATGIQGRPRRSKAPILKVTRAGSGLVVPPPAQARLPIRRGSNKSSKKRRSQSPAARMVHLPIRGDALSPPLPTASAKTAQRRIMETYEKQSVEKQDMAARKSTVSVATTAETTDSGVPFYMTMMKAGTPEGDRDSPLSFDHPDKQPARNPSRMTMVSTLTTTDEEYAGEVQFGVASRRSIPPDRPKAIGLAPSTAVSIRSEGVASSNGQWEMVIPDRKPTPNRAQGQGMPTGLSISTNRSQYRTANVPESARTDMFDAGASEASHVVLLQEPNFGLGSGMGMPWSPNFDWPATPPIHLTSPSPPINPDSARRYDYPMSISNSTVESWNNEKAEPPPYSRPMSQATVATGKSPAWKDIIGSATAQRHQIPSSRNSTNSSASTFFGGQYSPGAIPPVPSMPPPVPAVTRDSKKPAPAINTRQGWHARTSSSQSPIEKSRPPRQRQTGYTSVGGVNSIFATPQTPVTRPKLSLQRVEKSVEAFGSSTPASRYNSPYTAYLSPPSSAEPLVNNR